MNESQVESINKHAQDTGKRKLTFMMANIHFWQPFFIILQENNKNCPETMFLGVIQKINTTVSADSQTGEVRR